MLRISILIRKDELFHWLLNPDVAKVEMLNADNRTLKNPNLCRAQVYLRVKMDDICSIIGACHSYQKMDREWKRGNGSYVSGMGSVLKSGFIKASVLNKLKDIEKMENVNFNIPKYFFDLLDKYDQHENKKQ